jgi:hypothetical protein
MLENRGSGQLRKVANLNRDDLRTVTYFALQTMILKAIDVAIELSVALRQSYTAPRA